MRTTIQRLNDKGFTLVELLVAVTILSFGLLSVASLLLTAVTLNSLGKSTNDAMAHARDKIEHLKTLPSDASERAVGGSLDSNVTGYSDTIGGYIRRWQITAGPASTSVYAVRVIPQNAEERMRKTVNMTTIF